MDHDLTRRLDGRSTCALYRITWRVAPRSPCEGVPRFEYGQWPDGLVTATHLRRMHLKPADKPDG